MIVIDVEVVGQSLFITQPAKCVWSYVEMVKDLYWNAMMVITRMEMAAQEIAKFKQDSSAQEVLQIVQILAIFSDPTE